MKARYPHIWSRVEELSSLPEDLKDEAVRQCMRDRFFTFAMISLAGLTAAGAMLVVLESSIPKILAVTLRMLDLTPASVTGEVTIIFLGIASSWILLGWIAVLITRAILRSDLRRHVHIGLCTKCGYNLSGLLLTDPQACCPECAAPLPRSITREAAHHETDFAGRLPAAWGRKSATPAAARERGDTAE